jgi:hypothetical protein
VGNVHCLVVTSDRRSEPDPPTTPQKDGTSASRPRTCWLRSPIAFPEILMLPTSVKPGPCLTSVKMIRYVLSPSHWRLTPRG